LHTLYLQQKNILPRN